MSHSGNRVLKADPKYGDYGVPIRQERRQLIKELGQYALYEVTGVYLKGIAWVQPQVSGSMENTNSTSFEAKVKDVSFTWGTEHKTILSGEYETQTSRKVTVSVASHMTLYRYRQAFKVVVRTWTVSNTELVIMWWKGPSSKATEQPITGEGVLDVVPCEMKWKDANADAMYVRSSYNNSPAVVRRELAKRMGELTGVCDPIDSSKEKLRKLLLVHPTAGPHYGIFAGLLK
ncbi:hypothetical protein B0J17DRAFT_633793 [Rhizoctonia solani]|nr:hypothetical protein B0J17DRAFT_633793 [Rhizoctonia solani]